MTGRLGVRRLLGGLAALAVVVTGCSRPESRRSSPPAEVAAHTEDTGSAKTIARAQDAGAAEATDGGAIDPARLEAPWRQDHQRCAAAAAKYYDVEAFELVETRRTAPHRFLYFRNPRERSSEDHFGCRIDASSGEVLILHEG
jgi:hypothetical protein